MNLVDTSWWVHVLRRSGDAAVQDEVRRLMRANQAAWCPIVRFELWARVGAPEERRILERLTEVVPNLAITGEVWSSAEALRSKARKCGPTFSAFDLWVFAYARFRGAQLVHRDAPLNCYELDHYELLPTF